MSPVLWSKLPRKLSENNETPPVISPLTVLQERFRRGVGCQAKSKQTLQTHFTWLTNGDRQNNSDIKLRWWILTNRNNNKFGGRAMATCIGRAQLDDAKQIIPQTIRGRKQEARPAHARFSIKTGMDLRNGRCAQHQYTMCSGSRSVLKTYRNQQNR